MHAADMHSGYATGITCFKIYSRLTALAVVIGHGAPSEELSKGRKYNVKRQEEEGGGREGMEGRDGPNRSCARLF